MQRVMLAAAVLGLVVGATGRARADLIVNGGFETGDFTGWTVSANADAGVVTSFRGFSPHSGNYFAYIGATGLGTLSQTITDTVGQSYTLSMYLGGDGTPNEFAVQWNGTTLYDQTNIPSTLHNADQYNLLSFTVVGTGTDSLTLYESDPPNTLVLDDVSLIPSTAGVPEPSTLALLGVAAIAGLGCCGWRRLKQSLAA
jgi:hypothetical protein